MRRVVLTALSLPFVFLACYSAAAQLSPPAQPLPPESQYPLHYPVNTRHLPPPPPAPEAAPTEPATAPAAPAPTAPSASAPASAPVRQAANVPPPAPVAPRVYIPDHATLPTGTRIAVVLDTPLSTRISKRGQRVVFKTADPIRVADDVEIPVETIFSGSVVDAQRPGAFGKQGMLQVHVDRIEPIGAPPQPVLARLDSQDINGKGRISSDKNRSADLASLALWTAQGALFGARIHGGKGAAIGAGAGALTALLFMRSNKGTDVYVEPGTPFTVILDQPLTLPAAALAAVPPPPSYSAGPGGSSNGDPASGDTAGDGSDIQLSRRPKPVRPPK